VLELLAAAHTIVFFSDNPLSLELQIPVYLFQLDESLWLQLIVIYTAIRGCGIFQARNISNRNTGNMMLCFLWN